MDTYLVLIAKFVGQVWDRSVAFINIIVNIYCRKLLNFLVDLSVVMSGQVMVFKV